MQILRAANYKVMPWKNGLGSTTEIAVSPAADGLSDFDWRVSMAHVTTDGPFSCFPGIDRTLLVLDGNGIILNVADRPAARLDRTSMHSFPGDEPTSAILTDGPIIDLNVMSRRDCLQHHVQRINIMTSLSIQPSTLTLLFVERGVVAIKSGDISTELSEHDAVAIDRTPSPLAVDILAPAQLIAIEFSHKNTTSPSILMTS